MPEDASAGLSDGSLRPGLRQSKNLKATAVSGVPREPAILSPGGHRWGPEGARGPRHPPLATPSDPLPGLNAGVPSPEQPSLTCWGRQAGQALGRV